MYSKNVPLLHSLQTIPLLHSWQRRLDQSGWCSTANKLQKPFPVWTFLLCSLKGQFCQDCLLLVKGLNSRENAPKLNLMHRIQQYHQNWEDFNARFERKQGYLLYTHHIFKVQGNTKMPEEKGLASSHKRLRTTFRPVVFFRLLMQDFTIFW